jgi:hypothetical protein
LPGREILGRIQAPPTRQQTLSPENFMQAGDAAGEAVPSIEQCRIGIRERRGISQDLRGPEPVGRPAGALQHLAIAPLRASIPPIALAGRREMSPCLPANRKSESKSGMMLSSLPV